jgi:hypothetical protein
VWVELRRERQGMWSWVGKNFPMDLTLRLEFLLKAKDY